MRFTLHFLLSILLFYPTLNADTTSLKTMKTEKRVAFVIGNSEYDDFPVETATRDAESMKAFLQEHNFEVVYAENASKREIIKGIRAFNSIMQEDGIALFYFTGHTIQIKGKNYIIPVEASIENDYHVLYEAIELDAIIKKMKKTGNRLNILIINAASQNAYANKFRVKKKGLAKIKTTNEMDLILSSAPNKALKNYPFTTRLIPLLSLKGTSNKEALKEFQQRYKQPYVKLSNQAFYFNLPDKLESKEEKLWRETLALGSTAAYAAYLSLYPDSQHSKQASTTLDEIKRKSQAQLEEEKPAEIEASKDETVKQEPESPEATQEDKRSDVAKEQERLAEEKKAQEALAIAAALAEEKRIARANAHFIEPVMQLIKAGSFTMGSNDGNEDEKPPHTVTIDKDFYIGRFEVTNVEYNEFIRATKKKTMIPPNWTTDMQPAVGVSWDDANAYAAWLSDLTQKKYRLPTEEEWEYAARAGTTTRYYWGDRDTSHRKDAWRKEYPDNAHSYAWIKTNAEDITHSVGQKKPNQWGMHDVLGNVWEWCSDTYTDGYNTPAEEESLKIIRGGSWFSTPEELTLSHRGSNVTDFTSYSIGFRLVREK
jgi:formylglycine-generating enzyme required for sulfatase activity